MLCPLHHFTLSPSCCYCGSFAGGFVGGFTNAPFRWYQGGKRITHQQGIILASHGTKEEKENSLIGQQIRAVAKLVTGQNMDSAKAAWDQLPHEVRIRLTESGFESIGSFTGGMAATKACMFSLSFLAGNVVALLPWLKPLVAIRTPPFIASSTILAILSLQGSFSLLINRQQQIFRDFPGSEKQLRDILNKATKDRDNRGDKA